MAIILGIDPGSCITGYGFVECQGQRMRYIASGYIKLKSTDPIAYRLNVIHARLADLILAHNPHMAAIEQVFVHKNPRTALVLGQARGAAIVAVGGSGIELAEYTARQIKSAMTGYGAAGKAQIQHMVKTLLRLPDLPQNDEADALAIAMTHGQSQTVLSKIAKDARRQI